MTSPRSSAFRRYCAAVVAAALALQPLGAYAAAIASSPLAESALQGVNPVKPNIMLTVDDSASMNDEYTPDRVGERVITGISLPIYCRDNAVSGAFFDPTRPIACGDVLLYTPRQ